LVQDRLAFLPVAPNARASSPGRTRQEESCTHGNLHGGNAIPSAVTNALGSTETPGHSNSRSTGADERPQPYVSNSLHPRPSDMRLTEGI